MKRLDHGDRHMKRWGFSVRWTTIGARDGVDRNPEKAPGRGDTGLPFRQILFIQSAVWCLLALLGALIRKVTGTHRYVTA
jgi:hypothetical protein